MARHQQQELELANRVAGGLLGAITGAIWAFLRTWIASANSFNQLGRGLVIVGILLGWIPGLMAALVGLVYGVYKGGKGGLVDGIMSVLVGIEIFIRSFEENSHQTGSERRSFDWQRLELLPIEQNHKHKRRSHRYSRVV